MAQLALGVPAPAVEVAVARQGEDVVRAAEDLHDRALALADLRTLEMLDSAEVVQTLVDDVGMAEIAVDTVAARVHAARRVQQNGDFLALRKARISTSPTAMSTTSVASASFRRVGVVINFFSIPELS